MKVRIAVTVEVDVDTWTANYGEMSVAELRRDVQETVEQSIYAHPSEAISPL